MSTSPSAIFMGTSRYSSDFQSIIDRTVAIASLPIQQYQAVQTHLTDQSNALQSLNTELGSLQTALTAIGQASGAGSYQVTTSGPDVLQASLGSGATAGSYTIEVDSLGSYTSALSNDGLPVVSDPTTSSISTSSNFTLTVNGTTYNLTPASQTLSALADAINSAGAPVTAALVNVGSSSAPDYRLSIQGTKLASDQIQLNDGTTDLLSTTVEGSAATYRVNGRTIDSQSDSRTLTLAPGLTVNLTGTSGTGGPTTISVGQSTASLGDSLSSFVNAYNAVVDTLNQQHGSNGGPLAADSILTMITGALRQINSYTGGSGSVHSLADLGLNLDENGHLSLDTSVLATANPADVAAFLGSANTSGLLNVATNALNGLDDPTNGAVTLEISTLQDQITQQGQLISDKQDQVNQLQQNMQQQMSAADAAIAQMEQQVNYINGLFTAMQYNQQVSTGHG